MRQLAIAVLGCWLATSVAAHAESGFARHQVKNGFQPQEKRTFTPGGASFYKSPGAPPAASGFGESPFGSTTAKSHRRSEFAPIQSPVAPKPLGPQTFKPFKGMSTYDGPSAVKPHKPPKMKSVYDR
ncbi:MAG: hypothetical protein ACREE0_11835 [Phenylobacterium sp.]